MSKSLKPTTIMFFDGDEVEGGCQEHRDDELCPMCFPLDDWVDLQMERHRTLREERKWDDTRPVNSGPARA